MYNNDVTYNNKWDTPENKAAYAKLQKKYFSNSECGPDCPVAWAPEVLELMELLDRELGFCYNESTMRGYYIQGNPKEWFLINPWKGFLHAFKRNFFGKPMTSMFANGGMDRKPLSVWERIKAIIDSTYHPVGYGFRALRIKHINSLLNKFLNKRIRLGQLKEKYGELTVYFSCPSAFDEWVEQEIRKTEIKLALKGAYYPVESFWDASVGYAVGTEYNPDVITTKEVVDSDGDKYVDVKRTTYRKAMKDLGLDLKDIESKAVSAAAAKKATP